jgi:hypothetical protein
VGEYALGEIVDELECFDRFAGLLREVVILVGGEVVEGVFVEAAGWVAGEWCYDAGEFVASVVEVLDE